MTNKKVYGLVAVLLILVSAMAFSGTTGSLTLKGKVDGILDIQVKAASIASNLDLTSDKSDLAVATVVEKSNKADGYTVELTSGNAVNNGSATATLENSGSGDSLEYNISYDGTVVELTNGSATVTDSSDTTDSSGVSKTLAISYTGDDTLAEGDYTDTITLTIAAR